MENPIEISTLNLFFLDSFLAVDGQKIPEMCGKNRKGHMIGVEALITATHSFWEKLGKFGWSGDWEIRKTGGWWIIFFNACVVEDLVEQINDTEAVALAFSHIQSHSNEIYLIDRVFRC